MLYKNQLSINSSENVSDKLMQLSFSISSMCYT